MRKKVQLNVLIGLDSDPAAHKILAKIQAYAKTLRFSVSEFMIRAALGNLPASKTTAPLPKPWSPKTVAPPADVASILKPAVAPKKQVDEDGIEMDLVPVSRPAPDDMPPGRPSD